MRWSQGVWSEQRVIEAIHASGRLWATPLGPSGAAPDDVDAAAKYFERLERAEVPGQKRPDLIVFKAADRLRAEAAIARLGGAAEVQFAPPDSLRPLLSFALAAVECENSLWKAERMPDYGKPLKTLKATGRPGMPRTAVLPTVIIKEQDLTPLLAWQRANEVAVHVWQVFFDRAWGIALSEAQRLIEEGSVPGTEQLFHAPNGATTRKTIFKIWYQLGYEVGRGASEPNLIAEFIEERNGKILPYVRFHGGSLHLSEQAVEMLGGA